MNVAPNVFALDDPDVILDRHNFRRSTGVPTVSLLVGRAAAGVTTWRRWANATGRSVVVAKQWTFPLSEWLRTVVEQNDLRTAAIDYLAKRAERDPGELFGEWHSKTIADRKRFWNALSPIAVDDLLQAITCPTFDTANSLAAALSDLGDRIVPLVVRLLPSAVWPAVLFVSVLDTDLSSIGHAATTWAERVPEVPIAVASPTGVWNTYLRNAAEARTKALLKEGEFVLPIIDSATAKRTLTEGGVSASAIVALTANEVDAALVEAAVTAVQATAAGPQSQGDDDRARSAAERFLFEFLESLPETSGRFELNAGAGFVFGRRPVEVDLLCREPRIALEIDGYFHFLNSAGYRRDRTKDWELQRRGYLVLRFLAEDVVHRLDDVRDRILDALATHQKGALA